MLNGANLMLMIGPGVPVPAPKVVTDSVESIQVNSGASGSGFQITFKVGKGSPLQLAMLPAGYFDPMITRVIITVVVNGIPDVLMDGIVTRQELSPANEPGQSTLTITGDDLSVIMDVVEKPFMRWPSMPEAARAAAIIAQYAFLGLIPVVIPSLFPDIALPTDRIPSQTGTDLNYIKLLAQRVGYVFYIEPGPAPGSSIAYWGPDIRLPINQPALNINMDAKTNVDSLNFSLDGLSKKIVVITIYDPVTRKITIPIPVPNISILRPPLGARPIAPSKVEFPSCISKLNASQAASQALGIVLSASDSVTSSGSLDVLRYGRVLKARRLVGVRGAGITYDGLYYVNSVTHNIKRGEYKQNFTLSRDGQISNTPVVMP